MDAYFNELSCFPLCKSKECAKERAYKFASLLSETKKQGFNVVRCHDRGMAEILLSQDYSIADFCNENLRGIKEMLLLSMLHPPYFEPGSEEEKTYIENTFSVSVTNDLNQEERKPAYGLSAVHLYNSIGQNLCSCDFWEQSKEYVIYDVDDSGKEKERKVLSFSNPEDYKTLEYKQWRAKTKPCNLVLIYISTLENHRKGWSREIPEPVFSIYLTILFPLLSKQKPKTYLYRLLLLPCC